MLWPLLAAGLDPWVWAILGLVLGVAEMVLPGAYLVFVAIGLLLTGAASGLFGLGLSGQLIVLSIACLGSCGAGFLIYRRLRRQDKAGQLNAGFAWMIGTTATVVEDIKGGHGRIMIGDSYWSATGPDIEKDALVRVTGFKGAVAQVSRLPDK
jgi:membrane protein implicated in regulation of membrane protease activity